MGSNMTAACQTRDVRVGVRRTLIVVRKLGFGHGFEECLCIVVVLDE